MILLLHGNIRDLAVSFKIRSDKLTRNLDYDLRSLTEVEKTTESMRAFVANGDHYEGEAAIPCKISVEECLYLKKSLRENNRGLSFSTPNIEYDIDQKEKDVADTKGESNFIGEHVFLTSEPYEEKDEIDEIDNNVIEISEVDSQQNIQTEGT